MPDEKQIKAILEDFYANASPEEQRELEHLLKNRKNRSGLNGQIGPSARDMANNITEQMGLTTENIKNSAREIVAQMILQYDPEISNQKLKALTDLFVSGEKSKPRVPSEIVVNMLSHLVDYTMGRMPDEVYAGLPEGWTEKYWLHFPEEIQKIFAEFVKQNITEGELWQAVSNSLKK